MGRKCFVSPLDTGYPGFASLTLGDKSVERFSASHESLPGLRIGISDVLRVLFAKPSVEPVGTHTQRHIANTGQRAAGAVVSPEGVSQP